MIPEVGMNTVGAPFCKTSLQLALLPSIDNDHVTGFLQDLPFYGVIHGFENPIKIL